MHGNIECHVALSWCSETLLGHLYRHRTVRGISFLFVGIDAAGDLTSIISVCKFSSIGLIAVITTFVLDLLTRLCTSVFQPKLDILGLIIYGSELILWIGVFACGGYFNLRPWWRNKRSGNSQATAAENGREHTDAAVSTGLSLHNVSSSTSVFRTPSHSDSLAHNDRELEGMVPGT